METKSIKLRPAHRRASVFLHQLLKQCSHVNLLVNPLVKLCNWNSLLLHCVAVAQGNAFVLKRLVVYCNAQRCTDCILAAVTFSN